MKKLLLATVLFTGLAAFVPTASAGHKNRDRDRDCDYRGSHYGYREVYRPSYRHCEERPVYYRPAPVVRYRSYDRCHEPHRRVSPISFVFGF